MCVCVCVCVCVYTCPHACMCVSGACMHASVMVSTQSVFMCVRADCVLWIYMYVCMCLKVCLYVPSAIYMCVHTYCIGMLLCILRYYQQFPIDKATGESNLTQLYIQVSSTSIAVSRFCVNVLSVCICRRGAAECTLCRYVIRVYYWGEPERA